MDQPTSDSSTTVIPAVADATGAQPIDLEAKPAVDAPSASAGQDGADPAAVADAPPAPDAPAADPVPKPVELAQASARYNRANSAFYGTRAGTKAQADAKAELDAATEALRLARNRD